MELCRVCSLANVNSQQAQAFIAMNEEIGLLSNYSDLFPFVFFSPSTVETLAYDISPSVRL